MENVNIKINSTIKRFILPLNSKSRFRIINILLFYIVACTWVNKSVFFTSISILNYMYAVAYICVFILFVVINDGNYNRNRIINRGLLFLYFSFAIIFMISAVLTFRMGSMLLGCTFMVSLPLIMKVCCSEEKRDIFIKALFNSVVLNYVIIFILSLLKVNAGTQAQYSGIIQNPNSFGIFCIAASIAFLYKCEHNKRILYYIGYGASLSSAFATQSRTILLSIILNLLILCIYVIITKKIKLLEIKYIAAVIIGAVAAFMLIFYLSPTLNTDESKISVSDIKSNEVEDIVIDKSEEDGPLNDESEGGDI